LSQQQAERVEVEERLRREQNQFKEECARSGDELAKLEARLRDEEEGRKESEAKINEIVHEKEMLIADNSKLSDQLSHIRAKMEKEYDEFDKLENTFREENFELKKDVLQLKRRLNIITDEEACAQLGHDFIN